MGDISKWTELFFASLQATTSAIMSALPALFGALFVFFAGLFMAKLINKGLSKLLKKARFDQLAERIQLSSFLEKANIKKTPSELMGKMAYWLVMLLVITTASDILGWTVISKEISKLISYLPTLFSAIVLFVIGGFAAGLVRDIIKGATASLGIGAGKIISQIVYYMIFIIISLTALQQAGIDTSIISSNLFIILGAIMGSAAIAYGFASRDILANILAGFYGKRLFEVGQEVEIKGIRGQIIDISSIAITLQTEKEKVVIPSQKFIQEEVKIYKQASSD
ncbi:small-conductance mechanosensitive channel [Saprospira grandis DSM 2844]|uniref:Small-conductance mechanosensitive channel n=1 Tax=Saprospira grandis DSM 2844 TaxID=694433 RepID=J1I3Z3_9BACT|nr:mechanosensitive ion channel domain-containing protein [Saprospira grandis]EJF53460.1 small-conductance mechanosensitive channel [Saprospira grandis DSM 2844]